MIGSQKSSKTQSPYTLEEGGRGKGIKSAAYKATISLQPYLPIGVNNGFSAGDGDGNTL
jgi:hypothetical protein